MALLLSETDAVFLVFLCAGGGGCYVTHNVCGACLWDVCGGLRHMCGTCVRCIVWDISIGVCGCICSGHVGGMGRVCVWDMYVA